VLRKLKMDEWASAIKEAKVLNRTTKAKSRILF
jgi:hypothetical protein